MRVRCQDVQVTIQSGVKLLIFTLFHQQVDKEGAPQSEGLPPKETFSAEEQQTDTEQKTQESVPSPLQDQEKVSDSLKKNTSQTRC